MRLNLAENQRKFFLTKAKTTQAKALAQIASAFSKGTNLPNAVLKTTNQTSIFARSTSSRQTRQKFWQVFCGDDRLPCRIRALRTIAVCARSATLLSDRLFWCAAWRSSVRKRCVPFLRICFDCTVKQNKFNVLRAFLCLNEVERFWRSRKASKKIYAKKTLLRQCKRHKLQKLFAQSAACDIMIA